MRGVKLEAVKTVLKWIIEEVEKEDNWKTGG